MKRLSFCFLVIAAVLMSSGISRASLDVIGTATYCGNDYNLIYDDIQRLVWLDYTKSGGTWQEQVDWASSLNGSIAVTLNPMYHNTINWNTGWRLPVTDESKTNLYGPWVHHENSDPGFGYEGPDNSGYHAYKFGYNMINSEMGNLYYEILGNKGYYATDGTKPQPGWGLRNTGPFDHLNPATYWSGSEYSLDTNGSWPFYFDEGYQDQVDKDFYFYALAVHPGRVSAAPIPGGVLLLGSGIIGIAAIRKKYKK